jgi:hypothetical protein
MKPLAALCCLAVPATAAEPPGLTSLYNRAIRYRVPEKPYVVLKRADVEAVVVDNRAVQPHRKALATDPIVPASP